MWLRAQLLLVADCSPPTALCHMDFSARMFTAPSQPGESLTVIVLGVTSHQFCYVFLVRSKSQARPTLKAEGITQRPEQQEAESLGSSLRAVHCAQAPHPLTDHSYQGQMEKLGSCFFFSSCGTNLYSSLKLLCEIVGLL